VDETLRLVQAFQHTDKFGEGRYYCAIDLCTLIYWTSKILKSLVLTILLMLISKQVKLNHMTLFD